MRHGMDHFPRFLSAAVADAVIAVIAVAVIFWMFALGGLNT